MQRWSYYLLFSLGLLLSSCNDKEEITLVYPKEDPEINVEEPDQLDSAVSYLALGDSYTIGESVAATARYPRQLADSLLPKGVKVNQLKIVARTGWTTGELTAALNAENLKNGDYQLVSLLIGVNNQYRGYDLEEYKEKFKALLERAIAYAGGNKDRVFVISIPDYSVTPFGQIFGNPQRIAEAIDRFNAANLAITAGRQVKYFDITPISHEALSDPNLIASDGLHPSGKMYTRWVELMLPEVLQLLEK